MPDPFNQNFADFKADYKQDNHRLPSNAIFDAGKLRELIDLPGVSHVVFYPVPNAAIAVAVGLLGNTFVRIRKTDLEYIDADHNCPPDCGGRDPSPLLNRTNLRNSNSID